MFTIKGLDLIRRLIDDIDVQYFNEKEKEEEKIHRLRSKICDLITLKRAWNKAHRINDCNDYW